MVSGAPWGDGHPDGDSTGRWWPLPPWLRTARHRRSAGQSLESLATAWDPGRHVGQEPHECCRLKDTGRVGEGANRQGRRNDEGGPRGGGSPRDRISPTSCAEGARNLTRGARRVAALAEAGSRSGRTDLRGRGQVQERRMRHAEFTAGPRRWREHATDQRNRSTDTVRQGRRWGGEGQPNLYRIADALKDSPTPREARRRSDRRPCPAARYPEEARIAGGRSRPGAAGSPQQVCRDPRWGRRAGRPGQRRAARGRRLPISRHAAVPTTSWGPRRLPLRGPQERRASMSATVLGMAAVRFSWPSAVTSTSSSMRMPMPRNSAGTASSSGET